MKTLYDPYMISIGTLFDPYIILFRSGKHGGARFMMQYFGGRLLKNETVSLMEQDHMPARQLKRGLRQGHVLLRAWRRFPNMQAHEPSYKKLH